MRESMTAEVHAAYRATFAEADLRAIYQRIPVPTLLCIPQEGPAREASLALASVVPNCRVATTPYVGDEVLAAILEFMGVQAAAGLTDTAIILYADIADSTALTERLGDAAFREKARALDAAMADGVRQRGGTVITANSLGDGILATFSSASEAITAAASFDAAAQAVGLGLHVGLHAGDVLREQDAHGRGNVFGGAVNIAARVSALAQPGEVLVSATVRELARTSVRQGGVVFEDRGEREMKGVGEAVRVYVVRTDGVRGPE
jgi:class 3 adenylate cyclase